MSLSYVGQPSDSEHPTQLYIALYCCSAVQCCTIQHRTMFDIDTDIDTVTDTDRDIDGTLGSDDGDRDVDTLHMDCSGALPVGGRAQRSLRR